MTERERVERTLSESEQKFRSLVETTAAPIGIINLTGELTYVNKALADLGGYTVQELVGHPFMDFVHPEDREVALSIFTEAVSTSEETSEKKFRVTRRDGQFLTLTFKPTRIEIDGKTVGFQAIITDITERERMERELRQSEERYRLIAENMTETIWLMDMHLKPTYISPSAVPLRGYTLEELYALPLDRQLTPDSLKLAWETFKDALSEENLNSKDAPTSITLELEFYRKDGSTFWNESTFTLVRNSKGEPAGILGVGREITERKRMEGELKRYSEHLEEEVLERTKKLAESESRFREMADLLPQPVFEMDEKGNITFLNRAGFETTGYDEDDLKAGLNAFQVIAPESHKLAREGIGRILSGESSPGNEYVFVRKDGSQLPVISHASSILKGGKVVGLRGVIIDITERKRMEEALRESEERLETIFDSVRTGIMIIDSKTHLIVDANPAATEMAGALKEQIVGSVCHKYVCPAEKGRCPITDLGQTVDNAERVFLRVNGKATPVMKSVRRIVLGGQEHLLESFIDITEHKKLEAQLAESQRFAAIGETATMIGHDLRNPLQAITSIAYLAKKGLKSSKPEEKREVEGLLESIDEQVLYMDKIVSDLHDYAQSLTPKSTETSLPDLVKTVLSTVKVPTTVKVSVEIPKGFPNVLIDSYLMRRVLTNLVINAIQAMPKGGRLVIRTSKKEETATVSVQDTGTGIPEEDMHKLFNPFFTTKAKGQGLGLAVCKRLVEAQGGKITVESKPGKGTTFTVSIPQRKNVR